MATKFKPHNMYSKTGTVKKANTMNCLLYTSDAADE